MKISIITVCFNAKDTIEDTFKSIFNQTYKDYELIVIDGGSVDGTLDAIEKYKDKFSYFISEPDEGIYDAMNKGIKASTGDFLFFLNANDIFYDDFVLKKVSKILDENKDAKFLFGNTEYISEDKKTSRIETYEKINSFFILLDNNICHQSIFYHQSLFNDIGFYSKDYKIYADWDFNMKCLAKKKVSAIYSPFVISKFQLGGLCSSEKTQELWMLDRKNFLIEYQKGFKFLIKTDAFLKKNFKSLYFPIKSLLLDNIIDSFKAQNKYLLNIKTIKVKGEI